MTFPIFPQAGLGAESKPAASSTAGSASELANQIAGAYGGMLKLKEMMSRGSRSHCHFTDLSSISSASNVFECEIISKGDKVRIEMEILGEPKIEVFTGKSGWFQAGDWVSKADEKTVERMDEDIKHGLNALEKLDDLTYKLELMPPKQINGKNCDVLKLTPPNGKWTLFYVDPLSRLIVRSEHMGLDSEQGLETLKTSDYSDYRNVMGFPTPFKMDEYVAGKKTREATLDGVTFDDTISDRLFEMPEESHFTRLEQGPVTIPFEYVGNLIVVSARINNGQEAKFIVDTGASLTVIDKATAQMIGPTTTHTFSVTALAKAMPLSYTKLNKMQLGDLTLDNIPTLITDLSSFSASIGQRPAGLIGANILHRFLLTIDFQDKKLTLADPRRVKVPEGAFQVPTLPVLASTGLVVNGILDNKPTNFLVDTGAAFNNLPYSLAAAFNVGSILPVGQIHGLEGQKTIIGSVKLGKLKIGEYAVPNPVFAIQPDKGDGTPKGLSSASGMGILGNPIWSKTRLNIDYRNDRLIIEIPADRQKLERYLEEIEGVDRTYLRNKDIDAAATAYEKIMNKARNENVKAAEALALARLSSLYADKFIALKESRWLDMAAKEYERAARLAAESRNKSIEGEILAQWAMLYLNAPRSNTDLISAQNLLKKALTRAPMEGSIYAALGSAMLKTDRSLEGNPGPPNSNQHQTGIKFIDQALMLDPSDWQALWEKYKLAESEKKVSDMKLVLSQMSRYYPDFPQVRDLTAKFNKEFGKPSIAAPAAKRPVTRSGGAKRPSGKKRA